MLKPTLVAAMSVASFSLVVGQNALAVAVTQDQPTGMSPEQQVAAEMVSTSVTEVAEPATPVATEAAGTAADQGAAEAKVTMEAVALPPEAAPLPTTGMPSAEEMQAEQELIRSMSPTERHDYMRERHEQMRGEMQAEMQRAAQEMPAPTAPPFPMDMPSHEPMAGPGGMGEGTSFEERRAYFDQRYQELRDRARAEGVDMPQRAPWAGLNRARQYMTEPERIAHLEAMRNMSPEERKAFRLQQYQKMRERAKEQGVDLPETPAWQEARSARMAQYQQRVDKLAEYRERVSKMTPEDREACRAISNLGIKERMLQMMRLMREQQPRIRPEVGPGRYGQGYSYPERGYGQGHPTGPGAGYGGGYPSGWGGGTPGFGSYPQGPAAPAEGYGEGYPGGGAGYNTPWGYGRQ